MIGEVHQQVVAPRTQYAEQRAFFARCCHTPSLRQLAADGMQLGERRMAFEHRRRVFVDQRVYLEARRMRLQHREHRRREQHVAMVAKLDHERPRALPERDGVLHHPASVP